MAPQDVIGLEPVSVKRERIIFWFALLTFGILFVLFISLFFFQSKKPTKYWYITSSDSSTVIETPVVEDSSSLLIPVGEN